MAREYSGQIASHSLGKYLAWDSFMISCQRTGERIQGLHNQLDLVFKVCIPVIDRKYQLPGRYSGFARQLITSISISGRVTSKQPMCRLSRRLTLRRSEISFERNH